MRFIPTSLQGKFLAGLVSILLLMGTLFTASLRIHTQELLTSEARERANLIMAHAEAIQQYVRNTLRPAVRQAIGEHDFIIEAMSTSFISRNILSSLPHNNHAFSYRRVGRNARNPAYELNAAEEVFYNKFNADKDIRRIEQTVTNNGTTRFIVARPVYFTPDCMYCHGKPEDAPPVLLQKYGASRGFFRQSGELAGIDMISVPLENTTETVGRSITMFAVMFGGGIILLFVIVQTFFNRLVVHNLRRVGSILQQMFFQEADQELPASMEKEEEIEGMVRAIETMATHLKQAKEQLSEYSKNLEHIVQERTFDLNHIAEARSADVALFVNLLSRLNQVHEKPTLIRVALELIGRHFTASKALYACGLALSEQVTWSANKAGEAVEEQDIAITSIITPELLHTLEQPFIADTYWLLPVQTTGQTRGVLGLFWKDKTLPPARSQLSLALAFGQQFGMALDNLESLDTLLRQHDLFDCLIEGVPDPLILMGANTILLSNPSARTLAKRLIGEETAPALSASAVYPKLPEAEQQETQLLATLLERIGIQELVAKHEAATPTQREIKLGDNLSFVIGIYPLTTRDGASQRTIIHLREVTKEKQLLEYLRRNEKLAAVGQLAAGLAHEINNPLGVIRCYAELLHSTTTGNQQQADLEIILRHVESAQSVLRDLLDFARPKPTQSAPCDMGMLLVSMAELFRPKALSAKAEIILQIRSGLPQITLDAGLLEQALVNLILNALDALPESMGRIVLGADQTNQSLIITVTDNGSGISENDLPKIFDPFFSTKSQGAGTGLGLTIAFGIIRQLGGTLEATSQLHDNKPHGARFTITLPLTPPTEVNHVTAH